MLPLLICDDDAEMLSRLEREIRRTLSVSGMEAKIAAYSDIDELTDSVLSSCDIALLDIDFENSKRAAWILPGPSGLSVRTRSSSS